MSKPYIDWLYQWHAILDRELGPDEDRYETKKLEDRDCDFRMNFATWGLSDAALRECFEMLPLGEQLADRVLNKKVWGDDHINEAEAIFRFRKAIEDVSAFVDIGLDSDAEIRVVRASVPEAKALQLQDAIPFDVLMEDIWEGNYPSDSLHGAAMGLVHETLYQRTTLYEGVWYVLWPYVKDPQNIDPFGNFMRIRNSEISFKKDKDGLVVLFDDDHTISYSKDIEISCEGEGYIDILGDIQFHLNAFLKDYTARGFPAERFKHFELSVQHKDGFRILNREEDAPEIQPSHETGYFRALDVKDGHIYLREGTSLFFHALEHGPHTDSFGMRIHVKNGRLQRGESLFD